MSATINTVESNTECDICIESFNKKTRTAISCVKCDFVCCKVCFKRYITDSEHLLQCMSCHVAFDRSSLFTRLGRGWMSKIYRNIRENILYEQERALFPAAQELIEKDLEVNKLRKRRDNLDKKYDQIRKDRLQPLMQFRYSEEAMKVADAIDTYEQLVANVEIVDEQLQDERSSLSAMIYEMQNNNSAPKKRTYVLACTADNCKGMLSSESINKHGHYVCAVCDHTTCCECRMQIPEDDHDCDPDILATVQLLERSSKPCPSCAVPIFKISGCDQMFCTSCHASFSWRTLRLNSGTVHNPHHAEWLRTNRNRPRETADVQCGREPSMEVALEIMSYMDDTIDTEIEEGTTHYTAKEVMQLRSQATLLFEYMRWAIHHHMVTIPALSTDRNTHREGMLIRVALLTSEITESEFKTTIQRRDKMNSKRAELLQVCMTYRDALMDILAPYADPETMHPLEAWLELVTQIGRLEAHVNECFATIAATYGSLTYTIGDDRTIR